MNTLNIIRRQIEKAAEANACAQTFSLRYRGQSVRRPPRW